MEAVSRRMAEEAITVVEVSVLVQQVEMAVVRTAQDLGWVPLEWQSLEQRMLLVAKCRWCKVLGIVWCEQWGQ
jgi:hypothetical protein